MVTNTRKALLFLGVLAAALPLTAGFAPVFAADEPDSKPKAVFAHTALVGRADLPQYLAGLGTVQALNTVTMTARVDGALEKVFFTEGQEVRKGEVLAQIDPRPYKAAFDLATATKNKDEAQLQNARRDLSRYVALQPKSLASKQQLDTQKALVDQLEAQVKADQATIDNAQAQLDYTTLRSPIDGRTGVRMIDPGNNLHANDSAGVVVVTQMQPVSLVFTLPEDALPEVRRAMAEGPVQVEALPRDGATPLDTGKLLLVDNQIDQATGTIKLKATFPNAAEKLWPGQYVNARLLLGVQKQALTVPSSAAQRGPDGMFVYVVKPDDTVEVRAVKTGEEIGGVVPVDSGLKEGERVVTSNQYRLQPGALLDKESLEGGEDKEKEKK
jgi:multidrug efflux system membrane fusion protein